MLRRWAWSRRAASSPSTGRASGKRLAPASRCAPPPCPPRDASARCAAQRPRPYHSKASHACCPRGMRSCGCAPSCVARWCSPSLPRRGKHRGPASPLVARRSGRCAACRRRRGGGREHWRVPRAAPAAPPCARSSRSAQVRSGLRQERPHPAQPRRSGLAPRRRRRPRRSGVPRRRRMLRSASASDRAHPDQARRG